MNAACLQLTEATMKFPGVEGEYCREDITLWSPDQEGVASGVGAFMCDPECYHQVSKLMCASGMHWDHGPYRDAVLAHIDEMEEDLEHAAAYEKWCQEDVTMDDLHEPSYFTEWNQGEGAATWVGGGELHKNRGKVPQFTPEMLLQRDMLNWYFNFKWNTCDRFTIARYVQNSTVPDRTEMLSLVAAGENHGIAKCKFGAVYVPKSALKYLQYNGGDAIGAIFDGEITFAPDNKFPWRLKHNGIIYTY